MSLEIPSELIIEGVAVAFTRFLEARPALGEQLLTRMAELRSELMTPAETAAMLGITVGTLRENWREYGLEKSTALGHNEPRYFRSQVLEAARREGKVLQGRKVNSAQSTVHSERITPFPRRTAPTISTTRKEAS
jgi:hypothetical protein